jgi:arsenical pump membrane protein
MIGPVPGALALVLSLLALAVALATAIARPPWLSEAVAAGVGAVVLVLVGVLSFDDARTALGDLAPTVGFLAALLVLADGCRREGLFDAIGALMANAAAGRPRRLLALVFLIASAVTAVLSLDATVVLLTPIVFATAARLRTSARPHVYACSHLANSASLLLPVSNLTNLLAFHASGLSFTRFAALMVLPTLAAVGAEWVVFGRFFATELDRPRAARSAPDEEAAGPRLPRHAIVVVALTLVGFGASSALGIAPVWVAAAGALAMTAPSLARRATTPLDLARAAEPAFLAFVLGLGVIVAAASQRGLSSAVRALLPAGASLPDLLAIAVVSAILANLVNNLPATLILVPVAAAAGAAPVLAVLIGVNVGPNLTYVGSLATLLWRRVLHAEDTDVALGEFVRLGALTVPLGIAGACVVLWFAAQVLM